MRAPQSSWSFTEKQLIQDCELLDDCPVQKNQPVTELRIPAIHGAKTIKIQTPLVRFA